MDRQRMVAPEDEVTVEMTLADQGDINTFSRLLGQRREHEDLIESRKEILKLFEDALEEMCLLDDDEPVQHVVGDTFITLRKSEAEARVEKRITGLKEELSSTEEVLAESLSTMSTIKTRLYAKFGKTINLEES